MWKLKIAEGGSPWLRTTNNHVGRQFWEFYPKLGTPEELAAIEEARKSFTENRFLKKHSSDLLMRLQAEVDQKPLDRAARYLINAQMENGDFPQQEIMGVFSRNCMITYAAYRNIFPIWALGEYRCKVLLQ